jgi:G patch domain-containing protein 1
MATSRLKKKVERNVGSYGENLLESFVSLGTPLPSLASKVDAGEFKPIWEQEVVDDKGR